ncbi:hypothetical protein PanJK_00095 [Pantoea sp. JK]|nr:hypothetical protein [Pantoea sp. JK]
MNHNFKQMKINRHPLIWVSHIISSYLSDGILSNNTILSFSKYKYLPRSYFDIRTNFSIPQSQLDNSFLLSALMDLEEGEELAFQSDIYDRGNKYHIPLIDFGVKDGRALENSIMEFSKYWNMSFSLFNSGRSFHAYGNRLLNNQEWIQFMGSLLLINVPGGPKIIDDRWIGHRIMAGYAALRWSKNSNQYKKFPTHSGYMSQNGFLNYIEES